MFKRDFNKENFIYNWENIVIPGLIDVIYKIVNFNKLGNYISKRYGTFKKMDNS